MNIVLQWARSVLHPILRRRSKDLSFMEIFTKFQTILEFNNKVLDLMAEMGDKLSGDYIFDKQYIKSACQKMADYVYKLIYNLDTITPHKYLRLYEAFARINSEIEEELEGRIVIPESDLTMSYHLVSRDFSDVVGAKNANLAEIKNFLGVRTPEGFAITTRAFKAYMDHNRLWSDINAIADTRAQGKISTTEASKRIQSLIKGGAMPPRLKKELKKAVESLSEYESGKEVFLAIRSSAWGEDTENTFAGQFLSLLNEPADNLIHAYKEILASAYSPSAMEYRRERGYSEKEVVMAVACQLMVDAAVSGVLYTLDPQDPQKELMVISATWGLGAPLVSGAVPPDQFKVSREPPHEVKGLKIVRKAMRMVVKQEGGTENVPVPDELQTKACLTNDQLRELAEHGIMIERYFKKPQDIEFAYDHSGNLYILQSRQLNIGSQGARLVCDIPSTLRGAHTIFSGKGDIAQKGIGIGKVFLVRSDEDLDRFPEGAVLVARNTSPRFAKVIRKAAAVLTDIGSPTGHMATIAREFRVPTIVNTGIATKVLKQGQEVTVDAEENVVYEGKVKELCYYEFNEEPFEETYEYRLLRRVLKKISPLNLLDPLDKKFTPRHCKTFHDIARFIHEKAVEEIIELSYYGTRNSHAPPLHLDLPVPLDLVLIDMGEGLSGRPMSRKVRVNEIRSIPMAAFVRGLLCPGAWSTEPTSVDFGSFMSSLTRTFSSSLATPKFIGQNLAVISLNYANISLRLGYHFNMIDAYISEKINDNYAYFRFLGGVTDLSRRSRRAKLVGEILTMNDFRVDLRGDLVVARVKKMGVEEMKEKLRIVGTLVAFTRQLDVQMVNDNQIMKFIEAFQTLCVDATTVH
ncbi:MAG TPA: pyruvate, water dikinase [Desulfobacterales bacterium]|nr:pyruvate, water dikinase [Desulfobacterales bacterium]